MSNTALSKGYTIKYKQSEGQLISCCAVVKKLVQTDIPSMILSPML